MLRVDNPLVARVEAAERTLIEALVASCGRRRPSLDAWLVPIAGGVAAFAGPDAPCNKVAGLGFAGVPDAADLDAIEARYHGRGAPVLVELASHADPAVVACLAARGYRLVGCENVLGIALPAAVGRRAAAVAVEPVAAAAADVCIEVLIDGFATPDEQGVPSHEQFPRDVARECMLDQGAIEDFRYLLARLDGAPAGAAGMHLRAPVAHLCGAATLPRFRRRGVQSTLVAERLLRAAAAGCELAVTITQPGSTSQQNMQRQGFELLYVRTALVLPPPGA